MSTDAISGECLPDGAEIRKRRTKLFGCTSRYSYGPMKPKGAKRTKPAKRELKFGLPGTPEERRQQIRAAMEKHAETQRRLAE